MGINPAEVCINVRKCDSRLFFLLRRGKRVFYFKYFIIGGETL